MKHLNNTDSEKILVRVEDLWVKFNDHVVLKEINLKLKSKEILSIVGPNGGGKTTLIRAILGLIKPYRGKIEFDQCINYRKKGCIGYLPQRTQYDQNFPVNVEDVVSMSRYAQKGWWEKLNSEDKNIIFQALEVVDMIDYRSEHFNNLSGGQKQRVLIARALAVKPEMLILDEPSTGLDMVAQDNFYHLLVKLRDQLGLGIIMVSHDIGSVSLFIDRIACLKIKIHYHGKPENCIPSHALEEVFGKNVNFLYHDKECETCKKNHDHFIKS